MRRKTSKEILAESFRELAKTRAIDRITIKEIVDNCGYSPATFYRQFKDKYDLIAWDYADEVGRILGDKSEEGSWHQALIRGANYYQEHVDYLSNLLNHTSGYESFRKNMTEINHVCLRKYVTSISDRPWDNLIDICLKLYCYGTVEITCDWILGKVKMSVDELVEVYEMSLPEPLHHYCLLNERKDASLSHNEIKTE